MQVLEQNLPAKSHRCHHVASSNKNRYKICSVYNKQGYTIIYICVSICIFNNNIKDSDFLFLLLRVSRSYAVIRQIQYHGYYFTYKRSH